MPESRGPGRPPRFVGVEVRGITLRLPKPTLRVLAIYIFDHNTTYQSIAEEAFQLWAQKHGIELPGLPRPGADGADTSAGALSGAA